MNRKSPRKREIKIWKLTEKASQEIKRALGDGVELLFAVDRKTETAIFMFPPGTNAVQTNHCDSSCSVFRVPREACCCKGAEFLDMEISGEGDCDDPLVKQLTSGQRLEAILPTAVAFYERCGCQPYAGGVIHWQCP